MRTNSYLKATMMRTLRHMLFLSLAMACALPQLSGAQERTCAEVVIQLSQKLTFERQAFEATLKITNEQDSDPLNNLLVTVDVEDENGNDASGLFFVTLKSMENTTGVDGTGTVLPQVKATIKWLLIPTADAGGTEGLKYMCSAGINFTTGGSDEYIPTIPAEITVRPQPKLSLDYFMPHWVEGDDPFTTEIEGSVPFALGVRVFNEGYGTAYNLAIDSGQVEIVENKKGLLIAFRLIGAEINNAGVQPALKVEFGDMGPGDAANARWLMIASLMGEFKDFNVTYTHSNELGGEMTSLITSLESHLLIHEVLVDTPGHDWYTDFLAGPFDFNINEDELPDTIYGSDGQDLPVTTLPGTVTGFPTDANPYINVNVPAGSGWCYVRVEDPALGTYDLNTVVGPDGIAIKTPYNAWLTKWVHREIGQPDEVFYYLHFIDYDPPGGDYTVEYKPEDPDTDPPVTQLVVGDPNYGVNPTYVTSMTMMQFYAYDDKSSVADTQYSLDGGTYRPAYPFSLPNEGMHTVKFQSQDIRGNWETPKISSIYVDNSDPIINSVTAAPDPFKAGPLPDGNPKTMTFSMSVYDVIPDLNAVIEIARGMAGDDTAFEALPRTMNLQEYVHDGSGTIQWDGTQLSGGYAPEGTYTARVIIIDPLGHRTTDFVQFAIETLFDAEAVDPALGNQIYPDISGDWLVWQDERTGEPDIWTHNFGTDTTAALFTHAANQEAPVVDGNIVVWQDDRNGNWDLYSWNLDTGQETPLVVTTSNQKNAEIHGPWIVYQEDAAGNWDIWAVNRHTGQTVQITDETADQLNPTIYGDLVAWGDYRYGLSEIYTYDLGTSTETRVTNELNTQVQTTIWEERLLWVDRRTGNRDLFLYDENGTLTNISDSEQDEAVPFMESDSIVYEDYSAGVTEPDIMWRSLALPGPLSLARAPGAQRFPRASGARIVWQSNETGHWQVYYTINDLPLAVAGDDQVVDRDTLVSLDGSGSYSPTGAALDYQWSVTQMPDGSLAALADFNTATPSFTPDKSGVYVFSLTVSDGNKTSFSDEVRVTVKLPGDIDGNDALERADIELLLKVLNGVDVNESLNLLADINDNGKLGLEELTYLTDLLGD